MRLPAWLPLLLALAAPPFAWAGSFATNDLTIRSKISLGPTGPYAMAAQAAGPHVFNAQPVNSRAVVAHPATFHPVVASAQREVAADPATLCETAITSAEYANRLPPRLLAAISLTETGRVEPASGRVRPWPWTINANGEGQVFETRQAAILAVKALQVRGVLSIDVGCLQVNLMYHPDAFTSLDQAFDPRANASYAARFLNSLYAGTKGWTTAIAAYHSETPALGAPYRILVMARWQNGDPHFAVTHQPAYGDFAHDDKAYDSHSYGAFAPGAQVYGAFTPR